MVSVNDLLQKIEPEPNSGCWLWSGYVNDQGYGYICRNRKPRLISAHRSSYELFVGEIPKDKEIDHRCRVRSCVNPGHLMAVTRRENLMAPGSLAIVKRQAEQALCIRGHALNLRRNGRRYCVACHNAQRRTDNYRAYAAAWQRDYRKSKREN